MNRSKRYFAVAIGETLVHQTESRSSLDAFLAFRIHYDWRHRNGEAIPRCVIEAGSGKRLVSVYDSATGKVEEKTYEEWSVLLMADSCF